MFHSEDTIVFNLSYWKNEAYDKLIEEANQISGVDRERAIELYKQAQELIMEDVPAMFFFDQQFARAKQRSVKGYYDNPLYSHVVFFYDLYKE